MPDDLKKSARGSTEVAEVFKYDVFLSHSSRDKDVVRDMAERLRADGLRVWFDESEIKPGDSIPAKIEDGLEESRILVLCMSSNAFGSDWARLESHTFRFRDPLNTGRRFIPVRLDDEPTKGSLAQFSYIDWREDGRKQEFAKLLEACRPPGKTAAELSDETSTNLGTEGASTLAPKKKIIQLDYEGINDVAFSRNGTRAITGSGDGTVRLWDTETRRSLGIFKGHTRPVVCVAWSPDKSRALSASKDGTMRLWDIESGECLRVFKVQAQSVFGVAWTSNQRRALSSSSDHTVRLWDVETGDCLRVFEGHTDNVWSVGMSADGCSALSGSNDNTVRLWDVETHRAVRVLEGHTDSVFAVAWSPDQRKVLSGSDDNTVRLWDVQMGSCLGVLEGHTRSVWSVAWSDNGRFALSGSQDSTVRLWEIETGRCLRVLKGHEAIVYGLAWSPDGRRAFSGDSRGGICTWDLSEFVGRPEARETPKTAPPLEPDDVQYTNAKVLLVGDSGAGKTGLANRLAHDTHEDTVSTVGAWATQWGLPLETENGVEREIWLWDFGGQADQRLIHQLYMDHTHLAALVFDPQKEDLFDKLGTWDRDLTRAGRQKFQKLLVAGRIDAGGLRSVSRKQVEAFAKERGFAGYIETSAKEDIGCEELKQAIIDNIDWDKMAVRTSPKLFRRIREEIIRLKDEGRVLMRFNDLREALTLRMAGERFTDEELKTVISLLTGPGVVWKLDFGSWILLRPELINSHAQALIRSLREDEREIGCITEEKVLRGDLAFPKDKERLDVDEERIILLAMHQILVERALCLRDEDPEGKGATMLVFPSYARLVRPDLVEYPSVIVSYQFDGFLDDIYATLIVRLHHTEPFERDKLWRDAADFKTLTGRRLGVKLTRRADGAGELEVYFDPDIRVEVMMIFSKYVHEHLVRKARDVVRLRHYVCRHCKTRVGNREVAMRRLAKIGKKATIICVECEKRVALWDDLEKRFADPKIQKRVSELEAQTKTKLDSESKERVLVGDVISTVALAGQISREITVSDHGIDMEIEFKDDAGKATAKKVYLQLKSGDSHLKTRKSDGMEIFAIKKQRHAKYWMNHEFPVMLVIRNSNGEIRWMDVRAWLRAATDNGRKTVKQIEFDGKRFDVMSVRRWRDAALGKASTESTAS